MTSEVDTNQESVVSGSLGGQGVTEEGGICFDRYAMSRKIRAENLTV